MQSLNAGRLAKLYLANNAGFENRIAYGDLFRALRLPEGTALQQRISDQIAQGVPIRKHEEQKHGCIKVVFYWMTKKDAAALLKVERERQQANAARKAASADVKAVAA